LLPPAIAVNADDREGLTHGALAEKLGIKESTVRNWGQTQKTPAKSKGKVILAHDYDPEKKRWFPA